MNVAEPSGFLQVCKKIAERYSELLGKLGEVNPLDTDRIVLLRMQGEVAAYFIALQKGSPLHNPNWDVSMNEWLWKETQRLGGKVSVDENIDPLYAEYLKEKQEFQKNNPPEPGGKITPLTDDEIGYQQGYIKGIKTVKNWTDGLTPEALTHDEMLQLKPSYENDKQMWKETEEKEKKFFATDHSNWLDDRQEDAELFDYEDAERAEEYGYGSTGENEDGYHTQGDSDWHDSEDSASGQS